MRFARVSMTRAPHLLTPCCPAERCQMRGWRQAGNSTGCGFANSPCSKTPAPNASCLPTGCISAPQTLLDWRQERRPPAAYSPHESRRDIQNVAGGEAQQNHRIPAPNATRPRRGAGTTPLPASNGSSRLENHEPPKSGPDFSGKNAIAGCFAPCDFMGGKERSKSSVLPALIRRESRQFSQVFSFEFWQARPDKRTLRFLFIAR